ncbi:MAG: hypothetical protein JXR37_31330 [Kiritimatiellae bacterium]|nr:hypothetical protein [Kiritimatiellia bacterium]
MKRTIAGILVGLAGSAVIWIATPYNNFVMGSSYIADSYLPVAALFVTLVLVLGVNPLLRRLRPRLALDSRQLGLAVGIMLMACVLPGQGLLRMLPYSLAKIPMAVRDNAALAEAHQKMGLPPSLWPDKVGFGLDTPACDHFMTELPPGQPIPWAAWLRPLLAWGTFLLSCWLMSVGLAMIVLPQWRHNERLAFPLLQVKQALIEDPEPGRLLAPVFRSRAFWTCAGVVFLLHVLAGLNLYDPERVPAIPLNWNLSSLFTEGPLAHLPWSVKANRIYFIFVGIAFFMPNRIGFSIWFTVLAYAAYQVIGQYYFPPYHWGAVVDHRTGALLALSAGILWLGRAQWARVFRCLFRKAGTDAETRDRQSGLMFLAGCFGMVLWMLWAGVQVGWALFFLAIAFMVSLLITRIVAETGMPFVRIDFVYQIGLMRLVPLSWIGAPSLFFSYVIAILFPTASRVAAGPMAAHAVSLDETASSRQKMRFAWLLIGVLLLGLVVCGGAHLHANYRHSMTLDGQTQPLNPWGYNLLNRGNNAILELGRGELSRPLHNQWGHLAFGAAAAGFLQWACLHLPKWPLHPVGLLMVNTFYANEAWVSVFLGWLIKIILLRYGGSRLYRSARPAFMGVIMGEAFAAVFWGLVPAILVLLGVPYKSVPVLPL